MIKKMINAIKGAIIALNNNRMFRDNGAINTIKNITEKVRKSNKERDYKMKHKDSLGKNDAEIQDNLNNTDRFTIDRVERNMGDKEYNKVWQRNHSDSSELSAINLKLKKESNHSIDINSEIMKGLSEIQDIDISDQDKERNLYINNNSLKESIDSNNVKIQEQQREIEEQQNKKSKLERKIKNRGDMNKAQQYGYASSIKEDIDIQNKEIDYENKSVIEDEKKRANIEKYNGKDGFNFKKLGNQLKTGISPLEAIDNAGMIPNVQYKLDKDNAGIIRISNKNIVEIATSVRVQLYLESLIESGDIIPCIIGIKGETSFSIGVLVCDRDVVNGFGVVLLKRDKQYNDYVLDLNLELNNSGMLGKEYYKFSASTSLLRQAFPSAICMDLDTGFISEEDRGMLRELKESNIAKYKEIDNIIKKIRGGI